MAYFEIIPLFLPILLPLAASSEFSVVLRKGSVGPGMLRWTPRDLASGQSPVLCSVWFSLVPRVGRGRRRNKAKEPANKKMVWEGLACILSCCIPGSNEGLSDALGVWKLYCFLREKQCVVNHFVRRQWNNVFKGSKSNSSLSAWPEGFLPQYGYWRGKTQSRREQLNSCAVQRTF